MARFAGFTLFKPQMGTVIPPFSRVFFIFFCKSWGLIFSSFRSFLYSLRPSKCQGCFCVLLRARGSCNALSLSSYVRFGIGQNKGDPGRHTDTLSQTRKTVQRPTPGPAGDDDPPVCPLSLSFPIEEEIGESEKQPSTRTKKLLSSSFDPRAKTRGTREGDEGRVTNTRKQSRTSIYFCISPTF